MRDHRIPHSLPGKDSAMSVIDNLLPEEGKASAQAAKDFTDSLRI